VKRQPDFSTTSRAARTPSWERVALLACAVAALFAMALALRAREEARAAAARLADVSREVAAAAARRQALEALVLFAGGQALLAEDAPPARIVADVAAVLPADVRLDRLAIDYPRGGALELMVVARDAEAWDLLLERLERAPHFREVEPGPEARAAEVRSLVRARWAPVSP